MVCPLGATVLTGRIEPAYVVDAAGQAADGVRPTEYRQTVELIAYGLAAVAGIGAGIRRQGDRKNSCPALQRWGPRPGRIEP